MAVAISPGAALGASPDRRYEQVSPPTKGADVEIGGTSRSSKSGDAIAYTSFGSLGGAASRGYYNEFRSTRTSQGWRTIGMNPPSDPLPNVSTLPKFQALSDDVTTGIAGSWGSREFGHPQMINLWRFTASDSSFDLLTQPEIDSFTPDVPYAGQTSGNEFSGASDDFSHIVFYSARALTDDAPPEFFGQTQALYEWVDGDLRSVAILPADEGGGVVQGATLGYGRAVAVSAVPTYPGNYAISADGSRIFFSTTGSQDDNLREIYLREDDPEDPGPLVSLHVSASERTVPDSTPTGAEFQLASADGSVAFFTSAAKLTDDAKAAGDGGPGPSSVRDVCAPQRCDLYRWDRDALAGARLTDLTTADPDGGGALGVAGASDDGTKVYFIAIGDLALGPEDGEPEGGEPNLYLWQMGQGIRFIATLEGAPDNTGLMGDEGIWDRWLGFGDAASGDQDHRFSGARVTGDGRYLLLRSRKRLTAYDNAGRYQLYRYDAVTDLLECVSCNPRTSASTGNATLSRQQTAVYRPPWPTRNISQDGTRVFFDSEEALVSADTNGKIDVYEWSPSDGVQLISTGQSSDNSALIDASESGSDVFFATRERLVGSDQDSFIDLYDARVGGGFPEPSAPQACSGDSCQGPSAIPPSFRAPASTNIQQSTDVKPSPGKTAKRTSSKVRCKRGYVKKRVRGKTRCVKPKPVKRHKASSRRHGR